MSSTYSIEEEIYNKKDLISQLENEIQSGDISPEHISPTRKIQDILQQQIEILIGKQAPVNTGH